MNKIVVTILCAVFSIISTQSSAQVAYKSFGKGLSVMSQDSTFKLKLGFRFQNLIIADWSLSDAEAGFESEFDASSMVRRSRLKMDGWALTPRLKYKAELALSNRDNGGGNSSEFGFASNIILDAHITYNFYDNFTIRFGQGKLAGNRERVISSGNLQFVDRSRLNSRFTIDRDMFLRLGYHHTIGDNFLIRESVSIASGEGKNIVIDHQDGFGYTYRVELLPMGKFQSKGDYIGSAIKRESSPKLALGFTYDNNKNSIRERGQKGSFIINSEGDYVGKDLNTFFADLMFKYQGLSVMAEYTDKATGDDNPFVFDVDDTIIGEFYTGSAYNVAVGYMFSNNMELAVRYTDVDADVATDEKHYTIGLNKFIVGHKLKIQTDFSIIERFDRQNTALWRTQVDFHF